MSNAPRFPSLPKLAASLMLLVLLGACGPKPEAMVASAREYLAKNDPKSAVIQLKNALQENPNLGEARYLLGSALLRSGDPVGAESELRKAMELKYPPDQVVPLLAKAMFAQGQHKKLTDELSRSEISSAPVAAEFQTTLSAAYRAQGKADQARAALEAAIAADPTYLPARLDRLRDKAFVAKDFDGALIEIDSILAKAPTSSEAWKLKGDVLLTGKNQPSDALASYQKAVESKSDFVDAHAAILNLLLGQGKLAEASTQLEQLKKIAPNRPQTKYFETSLALQKKDLKLAKELSQQLLKMAPNNLQSLQLAGLVELQNNSLLQAEVYAAKVVQGAPESISARRLLATIYLRAGQPGKALTALQPILKNEDLDSATNLVAGQVYLQNGDAKRAEDFFGKANKQDPKSTRARTSLALAHLAGGRDETAFTELQQIATSGADVTADLVLISTHLRRKEFDRALKAIDGLEKKQPDKPLASDLRGRTLLAKRDISGAKKSFERAIAIDPLYFSAVASLASMDLAEKKPEDARKRFDAVLAKNPKHPQALLAQAELRAKSGGSKAEVAELIQRAIAANPLEKTPRLLLIELHLRSKEFKEALSVAQAAIAAIPESPELLDALGRAQQGSGDVNQAMVTFNKVAAMQPSSPMPQVRLAEAHVAAKNQDAAMQSLRKAIAIKPDFLAAQASLVRYAIAASNHEEALSIARTVQKQRPKANAGLQLEGDVAASRKNYSAAVEAYRSGLKVEPTTQLAGKLHAAYAASGKSVEADKFSQTWLKDYPKDVVFRLYLGEGALARGDTSGAEKLYADALQIQPDNPMVLNNLAWVANKLKKAGALNYAEKAVALEPTQPAYLDTLATLLSEKDDYAKALEWQNKALTLQPQNPALRLNLAKIHIRGGKKDLARKELDELTKLGDKFSAQSEVNALLKTL